MKQEAGGLRGATVSSGNSEIEIKSRGSEEHPGASKATDNPPTYFNVLNSKSKIPNTTKSKVSEVEIRRHCECCQCHGLLQQQGICPIKMARWPLIV